MTGGLQVAFYVSGHGFGHATRASALTTALLAAGHSVTIVTNAPAQPFASVLPPLPGPSAAPAVPRQGVAAFARYRHAHVDPGIVQPKAYDVDRQATYDVLRQFLDGREALLADEEAWLRELAIQVVLSDSTFIGCAAAKRASIPAAIVSNFSFDSCYSYLSHPSPDVGPSVEPPIPESLLAPLVAQTIADYRCASFLLRLPGAIPLPAFDLSVPLPSGLWVNDARTSFTPEILDLLSSPPPLNVVDVPMIVRPPSADVYSPSFRAALLTTMKVPEARWNHKILLVSFGGQAIPRPRSRPPSPAVDGVRSKEPGLLPPGWIAIVCGLGPTNELRNELPDGFYSSERDVYVPDLTATADCVLGKLGYGTCSETLSCKTPFIYVPRPVFIEELGLKRLMMSSSSSASTVELSRNDFEAGRWENAVAAAWAAGKAAKEDARKGWQDNGAAGVIVAEFEKWMATQ